MIKTILTWIFLGLLLFSGVWYFLLKESDFSINFKSSGVPGEIYQNLLYYPFEQEFESSEITERVPFKKLVQEISLEGEKFELTWIFSEENETESRVKVDINSDHSFNTRLNLLFRNNDLQTRIAKKIKQIKEHLDVNSSLYKVNVLGETISPATICACISLENELNQKALDMMRNIGRLSGYILESQIEMTGKPRVIVNNWDQETNIITYDFCFPVANKSNTPPAGIFFKEIPAVNSIKAIYNGNYLYSHLAWMQLLNYAKTNNLEVEKTPQEIFNDNPEMGGDARIWEAEIYMPLKQ